MEFDYKFWMFVWTIATCCFQWVLHIKLTARDVQNLKKDFDNLKAQYEVDKKDRTDLLMQISKDVAYIKGKLETEEKVIKVLEKLIK